MKKQLGKRMMSVVLLVCILVGILPTGISATEGAVDSMARGSTLSQEAQNLRIEINDLSTPQYTHNEKLHLDTEDNWDYSQWYKLPDGIHGTFIFVNAGTGYAINPIHNANNTWLRSTKTAVDGESVYGVGLDAGHGITLVHPTQREGILDTGTFSLRIPNGKIIYPSTTGYTFADYTHYSNILVRRSSSVYMENFLVSGQSYGYVSDETGTYMSPCNAVEAKYTYHLYQLKTLPGLTQLYDKIKDADWYLDGGICGEEQYAQLLTLLQESVNLYKQSNTYQTNKTSAQVKALDYSLKGQAIALNEAVENVRMTMEVTDLAARVTAKLASLTQPGTYNKLVDLRDQQSENSGKSTDIPLNALQKGGYIVAFHENTSNSQVEFYLMDGTAGSVGSVVSGKKVRIENNTILGDNSNQFLQIEHVTSNANATSSQRIKFKDGNYLLRTPDANANHLVVKGQNTNTSTDTNLDDHYVFSYSPDGRHVVFYNKNTHGLSFNGTNFQWTSYYKDNIGKNDIKP